MITVLGYVMLGVFVYLVIGCLLLHRYKSSRGLSGTFALIVCWPFLLFIDFLFWEASRNHRNYLDGLKKKMKR